MKAKLRIVPNYAIPLFVLLLLLLLPTGKVLAQEGPSEQDLEKAAKLFDEAQKHYDLQEYQEALDKYKEVYRLSEKTEIIFNLGQCYRQLGFLEEAQKSYRTFLRSVPQDDPLYKRVQTLITEVEEEMKTKNTSVVEPTTTPIEPTTNPALVPETPKEKKPFSPTPFYIGAAGAGGIGLIFGGVSLASGARLKKLQAENNSDVNAIQSSFSRAKTFGALSDVLLGAAIVTGGTAFIIHQVTKNKNSTEKIAKKTAVQTKILISPVGLTLQGAF